MQVTVKGVVEVGDDGTFYTVESLLKGSMEMRGKAIEAIKRQLRDMYAEQTLLKNTIKVLQSEGYREVA